MIIPQKVNSSHLFYHLKLKSTVYYRGAHTFLNGDLPFKCLGQNDLLTTHTIFYAHCLFKIHDTKTNTQCHTGYFTK